MSKNKNSSEDLDKKINNILKKDTAPMFNMFNSTPSFNTFNTKPEPAKKPMKGPEKTNETNNNQKFEKKLSMEKITMASTKTNFNSSSSGMPHQPKRDNYVNSLEKIIKKEVKFDDKMYNKGTGNFHSNQDRNRSYNQDRSEKPEKPEKANDEYKAVLSKFVSQKTNDTRAQSEYSAILGTTGFFQEENFSKNKNKIQNLMKSIQEKTPAALVVEEDKSSNKPKGPMIKTIESEEFFYRRNSSSGKKKNPQKLPPLTIGQDLKPKELALKLNLTTKNLYIILKKHHLESLMKHQIIAIDDLILIAEALQLEYKILDNFDTFMAKNFNNYTKDLPGTPTIAIVGHIDHGKTSLIERITSQNLCAKESGQITQKIASYSIKYQDRYIRLIDTPGHSVFKNARNLAVEICDFVILIVSATDGVQPQTIDSIKFLQEYNIPFITVITKIDINKKYEDVYNKLMQHGIIPTFMGGEAEVLAISSKTGENIEQLMEHIVMMSDLYNLSSDIESNGWGYVLESWKGKMGIKASVLLKNGSLKIGDTLFFNDGQTLKIKILMVNGAKVDKVNIYDIFEIEGLEDYLDSNEKLWVINDKKVLDMAEDLWQKQWNIDNPDISPIKQKKIKVPRMSKRRFNLTNEKNMPMTKDEKKANEVKEESIMKILICTRSYNDINAIKECLNNLKEDNKIGNYKILTANLGAPTSIDIEMLAAMKGCVIGFNIDIPNHIVTEIKHRKIPLFYSGVIYDIVTELEEYYNNQFNSEDVLEEAGEAEIVAIFKIQKKFIAGCLVRKGMIIRNQKVQLVRDGKIIQEGTIDSLKHEANDIKEAKNNQECGIYVPAITEKYQLKDRLVCWRTKRIVRTQDGKIISEKYV
jgi:translation initiation factor IF-2